MDKSTLRNRTGREKDSSFTPTNSKTEKRPRIKVSFNPPGSEKTRGKEHWTFTFQRTLLDFIALDSALDHSREKEFMSLLDAQTKLELESYFKKIRPKIEFKANQIMSFYEAELAQENRSNLIQFWFDEAVRQIENEKKHINLLSSLDFTLKAPAEIVDELTLKLDVRFPNLRISHDPYAGRFTRPYEGFTPDRTAESCRIQEDCEAGYKECCLACGVLTTCVVCCPVAISHEVFCDSNTKSVPRLCYAGQIYERGFRALYGQPLIKIRVQWKAPNTEVME